MTNSKFLLISFLLSFLCLSFASSSSFNNNNNHSCNAQQSLALLQFKKNLSSINDSSYPHTCQELRGSVYHPIMMNWILNTDCCTWDGVTCNHFTGDVIGLDLSCGMLAGTIQPNTTLFHLPRLQRLNLAYNDFTGSYLPHEIGRLANSLTHLNISGCEFTGHVPSEISLLTNLVSLDLSQIWLDSKLELSPLVFNNLLLNSTVLEELLLGGVNISLVLPTQLNITSSLKLLDLSHAGLRGKFPDNLFNFAYLEKLDLAQNSDLTGRLPKFNVSNDIPLKWLDLSRTGLSGELPDSIGHIKSLNTLVFFHCSLMGSLPKSLGNLRYLTILDLSSNMFNGTLPSSLFTIPSLEIIYLDRNMFSGNVPLELFTQRSLKKLSLGFNQLVGEINDGPILPSFRQLINLTYLDLQFNNFRGNGELDTLLSTLINLEVLALSYSGLSVVVTNNATRYVNTDFRILYLASCKLTVFPKFLRAMKKLQFLDLSSNEIRGPIPNWAGEIGGNHLYYLDLSHNLITGLKQFQMDGLVQLHLQSNIMQGPFPLSICNISGLLRLDMSNNRFGGVIPF